VRFPVRGCTPLLASVAAMKARSRQLDLDEHCLKKCSRTALESAIDDVEVLEHPGDGAVRNPLSLSER